MPALLTSTSTGPARVKLSATCCSSVTSQRHPARGTGRAVAQRRERLLITTQREHVVTKGREVLHDGAPDAVASTRHHDGPAHAGRAC
jgi:hypothetical protein